MAVEHPNRIDDKFWKLFNLSLAGMILAHLPGGEIMEINDTFLKMIGYTREEVIGRTSADVGWLDAGERQKMIDIFFANGGRLANYEIAVTTKSGKKRIALYSATTTEVNGENCVLVTVLDISARKKAEQQIRESEEKFKKLYNISHVGISVSRLPKGEVIEINDTYLRMIGYQRAEVIGRISSEVGWLDAGERQKMLDAFFVNYKLDDYEIGFTTKSGQHGTALYSGETIELNGETCVLVTTQDITERKKAEQKIRESEERFRKVFNISHAGIALLNRETQIIIEINDAYLEMIGYAREDVIGRTSLEVGWFEAGAREEMIERSRANNGELRDYELNFTKSSGKKGIALFSVTPIEINREDCLLITVQDITERKRAEQQIAGSEQKFKKLFDLSQTGIALMQFPSGIFTEINDSYLKMIEYTREEVIGHTSVEVGWFDAAERQKMIETYFGSNKAITDYEIRYKKKSGKKGTALISNAVIEINQQSFVLTAIMDITQRLEQEERKTELVEQLKQVNKDLESFSFSVSHDLRAPLRAIGGYVQMMQHKYSESLNEDERGLIDRIRVQTKRMGNMIEDILAFSRQSTSELSKAPVDMNELAKGVLDDHASELEGKEVILRDLEPAVGDSHALKQVFVNFITNALKYSGKKEHPVIEIGSYAAGDENIYFVKDNGAGFDMKYYDQLFQVFHRLHTQEEFEGNGVGLAIVYKIIAKHGGRVWAEGRVDEGATFYFSLPCE